MKYRQLIIYLIAAVIGSLILNQLALAVHDAIFTQRSTADLWHQQNNQSPFHWPMENDRDILRYEFYGFSQHAFQDNTFTAKTTANTSYFWLNLKGRVVNAKHYNRLKIDVEVSQAGQLHLIFAVPTDGLKLKDVAYSKLYLSPPIHMKKGRQLLDIRLSELTWKAIGEHQPKNTTWGENHQLVSGLRLNPVNRENTALTIHDIRLDTAAINHLTEDHPPKILRLSEIESHYQEPLSSFAFSQNNRDPLTPGMKRLSTEFQYSPAIVIEDQFWRVPERSLAIREALLRQYPNIILLPDKGGLSTLNSLNLQPPQDIVLSLTHKPLLLYSLYSAIGLLTLSNVVNLATKGKSFFCKPLWVIAVTCAHFAALWLTWSFNTPAIWLYGAAASLLFYTSLHFYYQPGGWIEKLGLIIPSKDGLLQAGLFSLIPLFFILSMGYVAKTFASIDSEELTQNVIVYPLWGLLQQIFLGPLLARQSYRVLQGYLPSYVSQPAACICAAFIFALAHLPNFALMESTFLFGIIWSFLFLKYQSILPLALAHGLLASLFRALAPLTLRADGTIGLQYYNWLW